jgi:predicted transcriptional regulator
MNRLLDMPLTFRQRRILKSLAQLERDLGSPVQTQRLADEIGVSRATAYNELVHLEHTNEVCRPSGPRSGWSISDTPERIAIPA